tara:strand:- start:55 stop:915 length:861 start_codon:yes stop_codon:yes gene_type:complete
MNYINPDALVECDWLAERLGDGKVSVVDASFHLPAAKRDPVAEFLDKHIPGARFFDVDQISDPDVDLPHMLSSPERFGELVGVLGIGNDHHVIAYDVSGGGMAAMRAWWMFRIFGHDKISVLDGGLVKWLAEDRKIESGPADIAAEPYAATGFDAGLVRSIEQIRTNIADGAEQVVDVRGKGRFEGSEPEVRAGLRSGHIPGSLNLPFLELLDADRHMVMRPADQLAAIIDAAGIDRGLPVTASCGSGVTACVLAFALYLVGKEDAAVYDGSWTEWGGRSDTPIEV